MTQTCKDACCPDLKALLSPQLFKALCDPNRLAILAHLAEACGPQRVSQVATCCNVDLSVVSRHLAMLKSAGILESSKQGKEVFYRLQAQRLVQTLRELADAIEHCCGAPDPKESR